MAALLIQAWRFYCLLPVLFWSLTLNGQLSAPLHMGFAEVDVTPNEPIFMAGYAARRKPSEGVDTRLMAQAMAFRSEIRTFVIVSLDNCEVSRAFMRPVLKGIHERLGLETGSVMVVSSHTHSGPILADTLDVMAIMPEKDQAVVEKYSLELQSKLIQVVSEACADLQPARLEKGIGTAHFAINRRVYRADGVQFGENPEGPRDWEVPVLRISDLEGNLRAIAFGYACHGTSISANGFYQISGEYMAYAREHIRSVYPQAIPIYLTGMGADQNPSPRGDIMEAKRHGLELAGAVVGVLQRPMQPVEGSMRWAYTEATLPLHKAPKRSQLEGDLQDTNVYVQRRAATFLKILDRGEKLPEAVVLPMSVMRIGESLSFLNMAGEVVVDYSLLFKRLYEQSGPWCVGYAYEVPCYIPNIRILKEGGYEADSSLIYYGIYGPFQWSIQETIVSEMAGLMERTQAP